MDLTGYVTGMIDFEGGGTNVVANPTGTPTDELESIQIGDVIYSVSGGGETIVPTPTNVDRSKYLGVKSDANELEYRAIREVPSSDGVEAGYVLTHTISGDIWLAPATELPAYSTAQNNKVLGVHNGALEWVDQSGGSSSYDILAELSTGYYPASTIIELSNSITNYNALIFYLRYSNGELFGSATIDVDSFVNSTTRTNVSYTSVGYCYVNYTDNTHITTDVLSNLGVYKIVGI